MDKQLWKAHLSLARSIAGFRGTIRFCFFELSAPFQVFINRLPEERIAHFVFLSFGDEASLMEELNLPESTTQFISKNKLRLKVHQAGKMEKGVLQTLEHYLPYCLLPIYARKSNRAIAVAHFAQSLDGRIATNSGDSRWIGNEENLNHAHRMRALCNGILVGNNTIDADKPSLTVRRVEGDNPVRVVIGSHKGDFTSLFDSCSEPVILLSSNEIKSNGRVRSFCLESKNGRIKCSKILETLFQQGIYSVYIEGGAITTSNFINDGAVDILQLHFSPLLFGSGKNGVTLPEISEVQKAIQFDDFHFQPIGNTIMFVGQIN